MQDFCMNFLNLSIMQENTCVFHVTIFCCWRLRWMSLPTQQRPIRISHFLHSLTRFEVTFIQAIKEQESHAEHLTSATLEEYSHQRYDIE